MSFIKFDLKEDFYTKEEIESELEGLNVLMEDLQDRLDSLSLNIDGEGVLRLTTDDNNNVYVGNLYTTKSYVDNKVSEILTRLDVSSSENGVLLLGNKSVIQSGDVATFIVTVYGENNLVVSDEEVTFEFYSSIDDSLLDTIVKTTSFKGIASCTYTGVGRGSVYCKASIQRNNSIIVSGTCSVIDGSFFDTGLSDSTANVVLSRMSRQQTDNGAVITATGNNAWAIMKQNSSVFSNNCIIEFDLIANETPSTSVAIDLSTQGDAYQNKIYFEDLGHYKIQVTSESITALTGSNPITLQKSQFPQENIRISFNLGQTDDTITYKDFVIYPI